MNEARLREIEATAHSLAYRDEADMIGVDELLAEVERLRAALAASQRPEQAGAITELIDAIIAYDVGRYESGEQGRVGMLLKAYGEGGMGQNGIWRSDAIRVWMAMDALAQPAGGEPHIPPLASYPATLEITEVGAGVPLPPDESDR